MSRSASQSRRAHRRARPNCRRPRRQGGFTLVECLLAGLVLAVFGAALASAIIQASAVRQRAADDRLAAQWLDEVMTRIDMIGPARMALEGPVGGQLDDRFSWEATFEQELLSDLYEVHVTLIWTTPGGQRSAQADTMLMDPVGWRGETLQWSDLD